MWMIQRMLMMYNSLMYISSNIVFNHLMVLIGTQWNGSWEGSTGLGKDGIISYKVLKVIG